MPNADTGTLRGAERPAPDQEDARMHQDTTENREGGFGMSKRQYVGAVVVLAVAGLVGGALSDWMRGRPAHAQGGVAETIEARQFIVRDENGYARIHLGSSEEGDALIWLRGSHGEPKLIIVERDGHPGIVMFDGPDSFRSPDEVESEELLRSGPQRVFIGTGDDGRPMMEMWDETKAVLWSAP